MSHALEVVRTIKNLPAILAGTAPDKDDLRATFNAAFVHKIISLMYQAFETKSQGLPDNLGHTFSPLAAKTIAKKNQPNYQRRHPNILPHWIMRASNDLIQSFSPGLLSGTSYFPQKNQAVEFGRKLIKIYSTLDYADTQHEMRPFWADDISVWISEAIEAGITALAEKLRTL